MVTVEEEISRLGGAAQLSSIYGKGGGCQMMRVNRDAMCNRGCGTQILVMSRED